LPNRSGEAESAGVANRAAGLQQNRMKFARKLSIPAAVLVLGFSPTSAASTDMSDKPCEATTSASGWVKTLRFYQWGNQVRLLRRLDHLETGIGFSIDMAQGQQPEIDGPDIDAIMKSEAVQARLKGLPTSTPTIVDDDVVYDGDLTIMIDRLDGGPQWTMKGKLERQRIYLPPEWITSYAIVDPLSGTGTPRQIMRNLDQGGEFRITITITTRGSSVRTLYSRRFDSTGFAELVNSRSSAELEAARTCPLVK
jgi:hypothetical protein